MRRRIVTASGARHAFGPVPSRRLGKSLGINNIPPKTCTYSCVYCQVGRTTEMRVDRRSFYDPEAVFRDAREMVEQAKTNGERVDYLTFVPDGEPTLDVHLGGMISLLKPLGIPIGVITNGSLVWREDVREELAQADWVSLKIDSVREAVWRAVDRPHKALRPDSILAGMLDFAKGYTGKLVTETMLVAGHNDGADDVRDIADFLVRLNPDTAYLSIPTRPPAEKRVHIPEAETLNRAYQILTGKVKSTEFLIGYEGNAFAFTGDTEADLLSITAVHPMREEAVRDLLARAGAGWPLVERLKARGDLVESAYEGHRYFLRKFNLHRRKNKESPT
ncbi:MAG: radical SAM protein [Anaerolineales bacterium]|nr:radical SAM protein [Anaerolineales bacterium]